MTPTERRREQSKAQKFWKKLSGAERYELGDQLVLGDVDYEYWFGERPSSVFLNELDKERLYWESEGGGFDENPSVEDNLDAGLGIEENPSTAVWVIGGAIAAVVVGAIALTKQSASDGKKVCLTYRGGKQECFTSGDPICFGNEAGVRECYNRPLQRKDAPRLEQVAASKNVDPALRLRIADALKADLDINLPPQGA